MNPPSTAREALIVEAMGEMAALIDRVQAVAPALDASREALLQASAELANQVATFDNHMAVVTRNVKVEAVKHIIGRTEEAARRSLDTQTRAMHEAARELFRTELDPALQRLVVPLQQLAQRCGHPWESWLTHAATAAVACAFTWMLTVYFGAR